VLFIFPIAILASFASAYWPVFLILEHQWSTGDNSYAYLIVPLFLYLLWERKDRLRFGEFSWNIWGLAPIALSILLILVGELGSMLTLLFSGLWGCMVGLAILLYGKRTRFLLFPLLILFFIVPLPPFINRMLTFKLKMVASSLSVEMSRAVGMTVFQEGNIIDLGVDKLQVTDACSGLRYFMSMILMSLLIGYYFVRAWWCRGILLILVLPLSIFINAFRIWVTGILTVKGYKGLTQAFAHDLTAWVIFLIAGALLILVAIGLKKMEPYPGMQILSDPGEQRAWAVRPWIITAIVCVLFLGSGWAVRHVPSAFALPGRTSFEHFPDEIGKWKGERHYLSKAIMNSFWADDYVSAIYYRNEVKNRVYLLIPYYKYQTIQHTAHAPQSCLLGSGWTMLNSTDRWVKIGGGKRIRVRMMVMEKGGQKLLASYFFLGRGRVLTSPWWNKFYLIWDAFTKRRTDGALVRAELRVIPGQDIDDAYKILEGFISKLWVQLPRFVPSVEGHCCEVALF